MNDGTLASVGVSFQQQVPNMQAIVIADDSEDRDLFSFVLRHTGLAVSQTSRVENISSALRDHAVDLIVLVLSPRVAQVDEIEMIRQLTQAPVIVIVERLTEQEYCALLDAGSDIVLERPVSNRILSRYVRMLLRRAGTIPATVLPVIEVGGLILNPATRRVKRLDGNTEQLASLEFRLLYLLMTNRGQVIPIDTIVDRVWGYSRDGSSDLVRGLVRRVRKKVEQDPNDPRFIENIPGVGYRFNTNTTDLSGFDT
jgi:DNA-binding response OmpR family regulator